MGGSSSRSRSSSASARPRRGDAPSGGSDGVSSAVAVDGASAPSGSSAVVFADVRGATGGSSGSRSGSPRNRGGRAATVSAFGTAFGGGPRTLGGSPRQRENAVHGGAAAALSPEDARRQQELDDEAYARTLMMEEMAGYAAFGGSPSTSASLSGRQQTARASCPSCGASNEFVAPSGSSDAITMRCGACSSIFRAALPSAGSSSGQSVPFGGEGGSLSPRGVGTSLQMCRRCGTMNQFPTPAPGQPAPNVLCGLCGHLSAASRRHRRPRGERTAAAHLAEEMLLDQHRGPHSGRMPAGGASGPMVRINVGGQRHVVSLALLLALMAEEEGESGNPARSSDIAALPTRKLAGTENLGEQTTCSVCLEQFIDGDDVKTLPCLHIYHQRCVEQWLRTDNSCPVCKTPIGNT